MYNIRKKLVSLAALVALASAPFSTAYSYSLLTTEVGYSGPGLDLSAFANGNYNFTFGPISVDSYTFTGAPGGGGNSGNGSVVGQGGYGLGANGSFGGDAVYIGVDSGTGSAKLMITSGVPVSQLGFYMNYAPGIGDPATIWALDSTGARIAGGEFDLTTLAAISTPSAFNAFQFRGISDSTASIYGLEFGGNYILLTGTRDGVPSTPDAGSSLMLLGLALGSLGAIRRIANRNVHSA